MTIDSNPNITSGSGSVHAVKSDGNAPTWAWVAAVLALAAWIALAWQGYVALALAVIAVAAAVPALRLHRGALRNLTITALIAALVLLVVLTTFIVIFVLVLRPV